MITTRRLATFACALSIGWLATGCAGSSGNGAGETERASTSENGEAESAEFVDCQALKREADDSSGKSEPAGELPMEATGPVASIGGEEVSAEAFNTFARKRMPTQHRKMPKPLADRLKRKMARQLVEQRLIERELDDASVRVERSALESRFLDFKSRFPDDEALQAFLDQRNTTETELRAQLCRDVQMKKFLAENYEQEVDDEAVADYYEQNRSEFETPRQVKASHILIKVPNEATDEEVASAKERAEELATKANEEGTDFAKLAEQHSDGPSAARGGDLGYFSARRMVPEFSDAAFSMEPGEISDPVRTKFGFHVIKLHDKKAAETKSLEEARDQIRRRLEEQSTRTSMRKFLEEAKGDLAIEYHLENIEVNADTAESGGSLPPPPGGAQ